VDLEVDTETGELMNIRLLHSQNVGLALNPKVVAGQLQQARHGLEASLWHESIVDSQTGRLLSDNWLAHPPSTQVDHNVEPVTIEVPGDTSHPYGATACGEGPADPTPSTFHSAIYNAIGQRLKVTPFTPDKILKALGKI